eukprot:CAMPEP_0170571244 /NCGR_PEP_ID=MMETSP0224-20130122/1567_1 /TAXON_ID=285029 /ORGANISM="Togula jolla, Strain CCCM 725" /LENGTH=87 /DNA_ID=CAMNT_0010893629 /DNA_START=254 /DNA_END=517 /DNA_ORIENTATION=+
MTARASYEMRRNRAIPQQRPASPAIAAAAPTAEPPLRNTRAATQGFRAVTPYCGNAWAATQGFQAVTPYCITMGELVADPGFSRGIP